MHTDCVKYLKSLKDFCIAGEKTNVFLGRAGWMSLKDNSNTKMHFLSCLVQDDRLKLWPGTLLWRWLRSIQPLPLPGPWNASLNFPGAPHPPRGLWITPACIRRGSRLAIVCCCFIIHLPFSCFTAEHLQPSQSSSHLLEMRKCLKLRRRTTNSEADTYTRSPFVYWSNHSRSHTHHKAIIRFFPNIYFLLNNGHLAWKILHVKPETMKPWKKQNCLTITRSYRRYSESKTSQTSTSSRWKTSQTREHGHVHVLTVSQRSTSSHRMRQKGSCRPAGCFGKHWSHGDAWTQRAWKCFQC